MPSPGQNKLVAKRRALKKRGYDGVTDDEIFERDGWQCQMPECLCPDGRTLDPSLRGIDSSPWTPGIHHITRLADGGLSNAANKQAAHNRCSAEANSQAQRDEARAGRVPPSGGVSVRLIGSPEAVEAATAWLAAQAGTAWQEASRRPAPSNSREQPVDLVTGTVDVSAIAGE